MKTEHFVVIFFIVIASAILVTVNRVRTLQVLDNRTEEYNRNIDRATDDAMQDLVKVYDSFDNTIDLDSCRNSFFKSLYSSFGVPDSPTGQASLSAYIPAMLITANDGFYVLHHVDNEDGNITTMQWTEKFPYYYSGSFDNPSSPSSVYKYVINYKMTDEIDLSVTLGSETKHYSGKYRELEKLYPADSLLTGFLQKASAPGELLAPDSFDAIRLSAMSYQITRKMTYYVNEHNDIAQAYGISYTFSLPESSTDSFARALDSVSILAIFQGYPYGVGTDEVYSRFSISGSRLFKIGRYYVTREGDILYYHRSDCSKVSGSTERAYQSKKECAEKGAFPCPDCRP